MDAALHAVLLALWLPAVAACAYLLALTLLSGALPPAAPPPRRLRFEVVVPAHDEAAVIARTVASLRRLDWPADLVRPIVVAHNCNDDTAALARAAGARVVERRDPERRAKGYALEFAFRRGLDAGWADAFVVVDADTEVSPGLLEAFAAAIEAGAPAVQAHYGVLNPLASWRTRLMAVAQACFHAVRSRARERLELSCGIRGNGWCVTRRALERVPYRAYSLAEDVEYGIALGLAGLRVHYTEGAEVRGEAAAGARAARGQRRRWELGRWRLARAQALHLLDEAVRGRSRVCLDLALDLLVPPLAQLVLYAAALGGLSVLAGSPWHWLGAACGLALLLHVLRGWRLSGLGLRGLAALLCAPYFALWKVLPAPRAPASAEWLRTERERR